MAAFSLLNPRPAYPLPALASIPAVPAYFAAIGPREGWIAYVFRQICLS